MNRLILIYILPMMFLNLSASELKSNERTETLSALENNFKNNEIRVNKWFEEISNEVGKGNSTAPFIHGLIEDEAPEFVCSIAQVFDFSAHEVEITEDNRIEKSILALTLYQWAGGKGYTPAMTRASVLFEEAGDHANSIIWEMKGVEAGDSLAILNHGIRLLVGLEFDGITKQNLDEGWKWIFIASELGEKNAEVCIKNGFGSPLSAIIQGKIKAKDWKKLHPEFFNKANQ